jgi:hypothetical protein
MSERMQWDFDRTVVEPTERQARALGYIAHYLDRIELNLERITISLTGDPAGEVTLLKGVMDVNRRGVRTPIGALTY